jgi:polyphosphate glucokinase
VLVSLNLQPSALGSREREAGVHYDSHMPSTSRTTCEQILAIDVGATFVKFALVSAHGERLESVRRFETPYPCRPARLVETLAVHIVEGESDCVGVGFPGELREGVVVEPGNLSRGGGIATDIDPLIHAQWVGFDLQRALCEATRRDVRVVNDATLAALGCTEGAGRELVVTLGTGFGIALVVAGEPERIRDVGAEIFLDAQTYDQLLGEPSRLRDPERWHELLHLAVGNFASEFSADTLHLGGGNARRVAPGLLEDLGQRIVINDNDATLQGAAKLFHG